MASFVPHVAVIDFHHHRGPEVETWVHPAGTSLFDKNDWSQLPFLALPDGAHASSEDFSYFTLLSKGSEGCPDSSLFGLSCTRQIRADRLKVKSQDVTRSIVQKAVVAVVDNPGALGQFRERLATVTAAWFDQEDFSNIEILKEFQARLQHDAENKKENDAYFGLSLRELAYELRYQTLVLVKCLLLQKRHSFFSPYTPLQQLDFLSAPVSKSYVAGSTNTLFLTQRDLASIDPSQQRHRYCDIVINLDEQSPSLKLTILDPSLRSALSLTAADRRWIDHLTQTVLDTWNPADPSRPTNHGYTGSEDAIRLSFEEYILSLLSSTAYKNYVDNHSNPYMANTSGGIGVECYADPLETAAEFNIDFLDMWKQTSNYSLWHSLTSDAGIFDIVVPRHPTAGGLNIEDVQRRLGAAMSEMHLDERVRHGRETAGKAIEAGRERVGAGVARFWKEVEGFKERREASRSRVAENIAAKENSDLSEGSGVIVDRPDEFDGPRKSTERKTAATPTTPATRNDPAANEKFDYAGSGWASALRSRAANVQKPDTTQVQAVARENAAKAGAYLSSWGSWARDKSREWQESRQSSTEIKDGPASEIRDVTEKAPKQGIQRQVSSGAVAAARSAIGSATK